MIKVFYGKKGMGKTKKMLENANNIVNGSNGNVVYIDDSSELSVELSHKIRFVNVKDYPVYGAEPFLAFICGVASQNYDIETIFIDGLTYIIHQTPDSLKEFFEGLERISENNNVRFYISINGDENAIPDFIQKYV
ncbi:MAG: hypothetical protein IKY41_09890 [Clostridia bacterium]|jgi:hypothetical protein|nr:hypothetical protein [Clostridia bacterium]